MYTNMDDLRTISSDAYKPHLSHLPFSVPLSFLSTPSLAPPISLARSLPLPLFVSPPNPPSPSSHVSQ